ARRTAPRRRSLSSSDTPTPACYTLALHDALPISGSATSGTQARRACLAAWKAVLRHRAKALAPRGPSSHLATQRAARQGSTESTDRKSTRLNSSHVKISYAVFCLKKKTPAYSPDD